MTQGKIIFYDEAFIENLNRLKELLETHDRAEIHRFLIDRFGFIFKMCQYYAKHSPEGVPEFEQADEETKQQLMRPLSHHQYRLLEGSFSPWKDEEWLVNSSFWDFLDDGGRICRKKVMSVAEVSACAVIYENVCVSLSSSHRLKRP
jgi:hypothetical protein